MPDELTEPGRATPARASSFLIENLLAAEAKGARRAAQGGGAREDEDDDDDDPEDEDAERARRRRLQRRRQLRAGAGPGGEARARALLGPGALGLGPRPPPGPGPPYALGCGGTTRWYQPAHGGYGGGLSPDSECGRRAGGPGRGALLPPAHVLGTSWPPAAFLGHPPLVGRSPGRVRRSSIPDWVAHSPGQGAHTGEVSRGLDLTHPGAAGPREAGERTGKDLGTGDNKQLKRKEVKRKGNVTER